MDFTQVILVDEKDAVVGVCEKMEAHKKGLLHRAFSIFIFNSKGEMLLQQRAVTPPVTVLGQSVRQDNELTLTLAPGVTLEFVRVPAGEFLMGSADSDSDADPMTFAKASDPANGSVVMDSFGNYTYTPNLNANGVA